METSPTVSPRERVVAAYKGQFADRVPAYPIAGSFAGCLDGLSIEEYCTNPKKAAKAMLNYYERYQPDIMVAFNDLEQCEALSAAKFPSGLGAVLVGPWTIAMLLRNPELMCLDTIDDPQFVHDL